MQARPDSATRLRIPCHFFLLILEHNSWPFSCQMALLGIYCSLKLSRKIYFVNILHSIICVRTLFVWRLCSVFVALIYYYLRMKLTREIANNNERRIIKLLCLYRICLERKVCTECGRLLALCFDHANVKRTPWIYRSRSLTGCTLYSAHGNAGCGPNIERISC